MDRQQLGEREPAVGGRTNEKICFIDTLANNDNDCRQSKERKESG